MFKKVLLAGESWSSHTTHVKGFDTFYTSVYEEGGKWLIEALEKGGYEVDYLPNHKIPYEFPTTMEEISKYACVILSDSGSNTLLLHPDTFGKSIRTPNRCMLIRDYVRAGGSLLMVGGYMSFSGVDALPETLTFVVKNSAGETVATVPYTSFQGGSYTVEQLPVGEYTVTESGAGVEGSR